MPTIETFVVEGGSDGGKRDLISALTAAVVAAIDAPADSVRVILTEVPAAHFGIGGQSVAERPAPTQAVMQAFLIAGRSPQQKVRLIAALTEAAAGAIDADPAAVRVIIKDVPNTDFGLGGRTAAALGRGVGRDAMRG
ncbi:tautomerase family protein [Pseudoduganella namucuonensis]|uniref:4-oxalocrotonate tautomerase family enzyme n=1 Tax=Pseudoduganella namucuonensis TaxID=1035707 RepID=A0A1I7LZC9_9BURK|nr:tautomerase family protein [Pseudoduganella namucuonensis]SFV15029.1 4-oxalocrotonate tautomerase family enzyme [Pseudoduganella namucuonensis]